MYEYPLILVQKVALYLGPPWKYNHHYKSDWRFEVIDGAGRILIFRENKGRFLVSGATPKGVSYYQCGDFKTIGVSMSRPPQDIAADINRRLIPHYMNAFAKAKARHEEQKANEKRLDHIAHAFCKVTKGTMHGKGKSARTLYFGDGSAELWSTGSMTLEFRELTPEQAIKIAAFAKSLQKP